MVGGEKESHGYHLFKGGVRKGSCRTKRYLLEVSRWLEGSQPMPLGEVAISLGELHGG